MHGEIYSCCLTLWAKVARTRACLLFIPRFHLLPVFLFLLSVILILTLMCNSHPFFFTGSFLTLCIFSPLLYLYSQPYSYSLKTSWGNKTFPFFPSCTSSSPLLPEPPPSIFFPSVRPRECRSLRTQSPRTQSLFYGGVGFSLSMCWEKLAGDWHPTAPDWILSQEKMGVDTSTHAHTRRCLTPRIKTGMFAISSRRPKVSRDKSYFFIFNLGHRHMSVCMYVCKDTSTLSMAIHQSSIPTRIYLLNDFFFPIGYVW